MRAEKGSVVPGHGRLAETPIPVGIQSKCAWDGQCVIRESRIKW